METSRKPSRLAQPFSFAVVSVMATTNSHMKDRFGSKVHPRPDLGGDHLRSVLYRTTAQISLQQCAAESDSGGNQQAVYVSAGTGYR